MDQLLKLYKIHIKYMYVATGLAVERLCYVGNQDQSLSLLTQLS